MNFKVTFCGYRFATYDECIKLVISSAAESDYITKSKSFNRLTPFSPAVNEITITGSSKRQYQDIIVDFDNIFTSPSSAIDLSPSVLAIGCASGSAHYWALVGALFKVVGDISPAYVTGYLLEKNRKKELEMFNQYINQLPFALQVALNEQMTDSD